MDNVVKEIFKRTVTLGTLRNVQATFNEHKLLQDDTYFDYELLMAAFARNHLSIVHFLLNHCRVRNPKKAHFEEAVVHLAMRPSSSSDLSCSILRKVLKNGASISDKNHNGETALCVGFKGGYETAVNIALTHISSVYKNNSKTNVPFKLKPLNPKDKDDIVHFHIACVTEHSEAVKLYVRHGFDVNSPISLDSEKYAGLNPVLYAASKGNHCIFESFLEDGDLSVKNSKGQTPLQILHYDKLIYIIESAFKKGNDTKFINSVDNNGVSHFLLCCSVNCGPDMVKAFINKGADVNSFISLSSSFLPGFTALHFAVRSNCEEVVKLLLETGADSNKGDKEGNTPLHVAINYRNIKFMQLLLENGADSNKKNAIGNTPLHLACYSYVYKCADVNKSIKLLLDHGACPDAVNQDGFTPLHKAFCNTKDDNNTIDILISKIPREADFVDQDGLSHFHIVCTRIDVTRVNDFLKSGVAVDSRVATGKYSGYTALHFAVLYGRKEVVEILLKANAQVNIKTNKYQETPLHLACDFSNLMIAFHESSLPDLHHSSNYKSYVDIVKLLLQYGAHVDAQNSIGITPMITACTIYGKMYNSYIKPDLKEEITKRTKEIIEILILNKANVNACTKGQESVLHLMGAKCFLCMPDLAEYLVSQGADIHAIDDTGLTPLHIAVKSGKKELVQIYLKHKADVNAKSKDSLTPMNLALNNYYKHYSLSDDGYGDEYDYDESDEDDENYEDNENLIKKDEDIICALLENDSDVNELDQNNFCNTLLHTSIAKRTNFLVKKLLYHGADINMEDSFGTSTLSSLLNQHSLLYWSDISKLKYADLFQTIFTHVHKLLALGSYVSENVKISCTKLYELYKKIFFMDDDISHRDDLDNTFDSCVEELNGMKLIKIDGYTSLYNILQKDIHELSKHVRNSTLVNILEDQEFDNNYPFYSYLLRLKYKKGLKRSDVLQFAKSSLTRVVGLNLPDLCCDLVLKYLTNEEITNLNEAARSSYKRKLQSNCSNDTEPSAKLQKMQ